MTPTANAADAPVLADELARFRVLPADQLAGLLAGFPGGSAAALADFLVGRGALTRFQADRALAGETGMLALGPYRLTGPHHPGTLGPVFRAERDGAGFVVRVLPLRSLWQAKQAKQLARTISALPPNPAVVPLVDADSANGYHYLVWPLAEGELLGDLVRDAGPMSSTWTAGLLARLSGGLAVCHARQVVHGLLSPFAVAVGPDGSPRLLDLGAGMLLTRDLVGRDALLDTLSAATAAARVFDFAAPEWVADPTTPTPAADQFSLGAIGYFALTGRPPTGEQLLVEANPAVPARLAGAIDRLLRPDPADRFGGMEEVKEVFAGLAGDTDPLPPSPEPAPAPAPRQAEAPKPAAVWGRSGPIARPPARDESEASVRFDDPLPVPTPEPVAAVPPPPAAPVPGGVSVPSVAGVCDPGPASQRPATEERPTNPRHDPVPPPAPPRRSSPPPPAAKKEFTPPPLLPVEPLSTPPPAETTKPAEAGPRPDSESAASMPAPTVSAAPTPSGSLLWKRVKRKVMFWHTPVETVQVSVFGPAAVAHGHPHKLTVFLHPPITAESVATLARAFHHDAQLLVTVPLGVRVPSETKLAVQVAAPPLAVANPLQAFVWRGAPHRLTFHLVVPWGAPAGPAAGLVAVGRDDERIGTAEFGIPVLTRKG